MTDKNIYDNKVLNLYEELETDLLALIITNLQKYENIESMSRIEFRRAIKNEGRKIYKEALKETTKMNTKRRKALNKLFEENVIDEVERKYDEFNVGRKQKKIINNNIKLTDNNLRKLSKEISFDVQDKMVSAMGNMYRNVVLADEDFQGAFKRVAKEITESGLTYTDKAGRNRSIEATVRQDLLYRINETNREIYKDVGEKLGLNGVQLNITPNCRDSHQVINGQVFTNEEWKKYEYLTHDYNCQHIAEPVDIDIQGNVYTQSEIDFANNRTVMYNGDEISYYDATQKQRALERAIRNAKKNLVVAQKTNINVSQAKKVLNNTWQRMRDFINETGLIRDYDREFYAGYN